MPLATNTMRVGGAVAFWKLAPRTHRETVSQHLKSWGYEKHIPSERGTKALLKEAVSEVYPGMLVRPLRATNSFEVIKEEIHDEENEYKHVAAFSVQGEQGDEGVTSPDLGNASSAVTQVQEAFEHAKEDITGPQVAALLTGLIEMEFKGLSLRPTGGLYWVPGDCLEEFRRIGKAIEDCASKGETQVFSLETKFDQNAVKAVLAGVNDEVQRELALIKDDLDTGTLGKRALTKRIAHLRELRAKTTQYETSCGESMEKLHEAIKQFEDHESIAALLAGVDHTVTPPAPTI